MCAGHRQHMAALQHMFGQPLRAAGVGCAGVQNGLHQREFGCAVGQVGAAHHIADHIYIRLQRHLVGPKTLDQLNAQGAQLVAHGGVDTRVATRHAVAGFARQCGQAAHESPTNTKNMNMHGLILRACGEQTFQVFYASSPYVICASSYQN